MLTVFCSTVEGKLAFIVIQEIIVEVQSYHTAFFTQQFQLCIIQVSSVTTQSTGTGVGRNKRLLAVFCHVIEHAFGRMRQVDNHTQTVHFLDDFETKRLQTAQVFFSVIPAWITDFVFKIPQQSNHADVIIICLFHTFNFPLKTYTVFDGQHAAHLSGCLVIHNFLPAACFSNQVSVRIHFTVINVHQRAVILVRIGRFHRLSGNPYSKKLAQCLSFLQLHQIDVSFVFSQLPVWILPASHQCIAMEIYNSHVTHNLPLLFLPFIDFFNKFFLLLSLIL